MMSHYKIDKDGWHDLTEERIKDSVAYWKSEGYVLVHRDDVKDLVAYLSTKIQVPRNIKEVNDRLWNILEE